MAPLTKHCIIVERSCWHCPPSPCNTSKNHCLKLIDQGKRKLFFFKLREKSGENKIKSLCNPGTASHLKKKVSKRKIVKKRKENDYKNQCELLNFCYIYIKSKVKGECWMEIF